MFTQPSQVAPGSHEVTLVGPGELAVTDESRVEVLAAASGGAAELVTEAQTYTFTCTGGTDERSATLRSVPES